VIELVLFTFVFVALNVAVPFIDDSPVEDVTLVSTVSTPSVKTYVVTIIFVLDGVDSGTCGAGRFRKRPQVLFGLFVLVVVFAEGDKADSRLSSVTFVAVVIFVVESLDDSIGEGLSGAFRRCHGIVICLVALLAGTSAVVASGVGFVFFGERRKKEKGFFGGVALSVASSLRLLRRRRFSFVFSVSFDELSLTLVAPSRCNSEKNRGRLLLSLLFVTSDHGAQRGKKSFREEDVAVVALDENAIQRRMRWTFRNKLFICDVYFPLLKLY
jgi:hypothetical protein